LGLNAFLYIFRAKGMCVVAADIVFPAEGGNSDPSNPLAGFKATFPVTALTNKTTGWAINS